MPGPDRSAESERARYYLTTAIAYANNRPGLHTLFEVIGADAIALHGFLNVIATICVYYNVGFIRLPE